MRKFQAIADPVKCAHLAFRREFAANQIGECVDGLFFVRAARFDGDGATDRRRERHRGDDTPSIGPASRYSEPNTAAEPRSKVRNLGRWACVNSQRIGNFDLNFLHRVEIGKLRW